MSMNDPTGPTTAPTTTPDPSQAGTAGPTPPVANNPAPAPAPNPGLPVDPAAPPAPTPADPAAARIAELEAQIAQLEAAAAPPAAPPTPAPVANPPKVGDLVVYSYDDPLEGHSEQYGVVHGLESDEAGNPNRATVLWFAGLSGAIELGMLERQEATS